MKRLFGILILLLSAAVLLTACRGGGSTIPPVATGTAPPPTSYAVHGKVATLAFEDEFNNGSLDQTKWTVIARHGEYSQYETECNVPGAVSVDPNGYLTITTSAQSATCGDIYPDGSVWHTPTSWPYTTGDIQWKSYNFMYPAGGSATVEVRARFPSSNTGTWPAIWMLGSNCQATNPMTGETNVGSCPGVGTPGYTEIDMVECFGSTWCQFNVFNPDQNRCNTTYAVDTNWHVFKTVWTSSSISQYMDGNLITTCNQSMSNPMFLMIQTQTGGVGGTPNNSYLPADLNVDYVRINTGQPGPINGTISCTSPVTSGNTATCTISPNSGYAVGYVSSTCGGSLNGNVFTTGAVTADCTVSTTFY